MKPEEDKFNKTEPLMKHFKKEFKFVRKELARDKVKERAVLWKDILDIEQGKQSESDK